MAASSRPHLTVSMVASGAVPQYSPVTIAGAVAAAGAEIIGISRTSVSSGATMPVTCSGSEICFVGSAVVFGQKLQVGSGGTVVPQTTGVCIGRALNDATVGNSVEVLIIPKGDEGGAGVSTYAALTDAASVDLSAINTPLANALATKAVALAPVTLTTNTTLTRSAHYNRQITVTTAGAVTLTATGTDALVGDFIAVNVTGGGTVTLAGVTAQAGFTLTAVSGRNVEAVCMVAASLIAATRVGVEAGTTVSSSRSITSADLEKVLDVTATATLTIPNDATLGISATWRGAFATSQTTAAYPSFTAPNAIQGSAATTGVGAMQILRHVAADTWAYA